MTDNFAQDIAQMHDHYGFPKVDPSIAKKFLEMRRDFIQEELTELDLAIKNNVPEDIVDALIDIAYVAFGTLDLLNINVNEAWDLVFQANMQKQPGVNTKRRNSHGFPDLIKPEGWSAPDHRNNLGGLK